MITVLFLIVGCDEKDSRPSILEMKVQKNKQPDGSYQIALEWNVEYNIDVVESLDFFRILITTESRQMQNSIIRDIDLVRAHNTVCCITSTRIEYNSVY